MSMIFSWFKMKNGGRFCDDGFAFAPMPEFAENGKRRAVQVAAPLDAPDGIAVHDRRLRAFGDQSRAAFLMPREPVLLLEF